MSGGGSRQAWLAANSLRLKLLGFLMLAVALAALAQTAVAYRAALDEADQIFDYHMQRIADSLARGLPVAAQPLPDVPAGGDGHFDFVVQVWAADGALRFHSAPAAELPQRAVLGWSEVRAREARYRVWSVVTPAQTIQVAQDLSVRESLARGLALRTVTPVLALAPLLMIVVWVVVRRSLAPVDRVRADVASRAANDLSPLDEGDLPAEVRPLVAEINLLFARLQQAFDAQTHFVADAAHELRSPLTALKLQVQALRRAGDGPTRETALARLDAGTDRAARLVEQLLALARQDAQPTDTDGVVDLQEVVRLAVADAVPAALRKQLDVALQPAGLAPVRGQAEALRMLTRNLLDNAVKYTPDGGAVQVSVQPQGGRVTLRVEDSGPGIDAGLREAVLGRFHRVPGNQAPGSGLGLAIVKAVADRHGAMLALGHSDLLGGLCVEVVFTSAPPAVSA